MQSMLQSNFRTCAKRTIALKALEQQNDTSKVESKNSTNEEKSLMSRKFKQMLKHNG